MGENKMQLKDEVKFLLGVRKKIDNLSTNKTDVDKTFMAILEDLKKQMQISNDAIEIMNELSAEIKVTVSKVQSSYTRTTC